MKEHALSTLETSMKYTLDVAAAMPEKAYHFRPENGGWDFSELMNHITYGIYWWQENYVKNQETAWDPPAPKNGKQSVIACLSDAYTDLKSTLGSVKWNDRVLQGLYATLDHITHHRGQAVVYLRCSGIEPPEYVY
ncbi:hypothetical protein A8C56_18820 [Niabella ginsenosidivorans]|uniref:Damage-inducible protein DinB n=1 Tax=Niabella ginsenosidivorans TaxID=1176587 RepID=A0A1A9I4Z6_9BACT|nr:DinB family protein [Niabella ginsenosidivorans]ANH82757.1 hypothetical protein A8C56_18820 [Niabella ginsenosidivorans]